MGEFKIGDGEGRMEGEGFTTGGAGGGEARLNEAGEKP